MHKRSYVSGHEDHLHYFSDIKIDKLNNRYKSKSDENSELLFLLKNLSDPTKLNIYLLLSEVKEMPVTDIVNILGLSQSAISHSLSDLKKLNLVKCHRCGQLICYSIKKQPKYKSNLLKTLNKSLSGGDQRE